LRGHVDRQFRRNILQSREKLVSRVTKQIRLVLLSSSLVLPGCEQRTHWSHSVERRVANMPPACAPVDGRTAGPSGIRVEDDGCYVDGNVPQGQVVDNRSGVHTGYVAPIGYIGSHSGLGGGYVNRPVGNSWGRSSTVGGGASNFNGAHSNTSSSHSNFSSTSSRSSSSSSRSSVGSVRGGFGSSAHHGVSS
jgi:hypothetical protein